MDNCRKEKLLETMKNFNKKHKQEVFKFADTTDDYTTISTGIKNIDSFIGGGFKKGAHTILYGAYSIGKTALALSTIANAQKDGLIVAMINTEKPIDKSRMEFFGIDLSTMIYIESPSNAELALETIRTLCKEKLVDLFVIDSTNGLSPKATQEDSNGKERELDKRDIGALASTLSSFYNKVNAYIFQAKVGVIWIGQTRTTGLGSFFVHQGLSAGVAQKFYAYQIIYMRQDQKSNNPTRKVRNYFLDPDGKLRYETVDEEVGFGIVFKMEKTNSSKSVIQGKELCIPFYHETGFHPLPEKEMEIKIEANSPEEEEKIRQMLIEKGILPKEDEEILSNQEQDGSVNECVEEEKIDENIEPTEPQNNNEQPKKRGRKPKKG